MPEILKHSNTGSGDKPGMSVCFSLIIPYHNSEISDRSDMLDALADSLPDRPELEILWIDDGSDIRWTPSRLFTAASSRVVPNRPSRRYAGTARNTGLEEARGTWILFADSDDLFDTQKLNEVLDRVAADAEGNTDLFMFSITSFEHATGAPSDRHEYSMEKLRQARDAQDVAALSRLYVPYGRVVRKSHIEENRIRFGATRVANDALFAVDLALSAPRVCYIPVEAYRLRAGNDSLTGHASSKSISDRFDVWRKINDRLRAAGRGDLIDPLIYRIRALWLSNPVAVSRQVVISLLRRDRLFRSAGSPARAAVRLLTSRRP